MECVTQTSVVRKAKKKPVKGEFDRLKQAEKKKRRLEKALATSAAIRSELERKKQTKKEELMRLEEEGAATAEAAALYVLLGDDTEDSRNMDIIYGDRHRMVPYKNTSKYCIEGITLISNSDIHEHEWHHWENSVCSLDKDVFSQYPEEMGFCSVEICDDHIAFQGVASLKIGDDSV